MLLAAAGGLPALTLVERAGRAGPELLHTTMAEMAAADLTQPIKVRAVAALVDRLALALMVVRLVLTAMVAVKAAAVPMAVPLQAIQLVRQVRLAA